MPTIVHFEIPSDNLERTRKFYTELFGWKMEKMPGTSQREYWMFSTTSKGEGSSSNNSGSGGEQQRMVSGGMMQRQMPQEPIMIYIGVDSVTEYSDKVERLGGKVIKQKTEVPNYGWFAICTDTENNGFALWEASTILDKYVHYSTTSTNHVQFASNNFSKRIILVSPPPPSFSVAT